MRDVTPIKVRGKKSKPLKPSGQTSDFTETALPRFAEARSRATTSRESRPPSGQTTPRYLPSPRRALSSVERLPTEILEEIFLYALDISFPRSSHIIGSKLSSQHTYHAFAHIVFGSFKDQHGNRYRTNSALTDIPTNIVIKARNEALLCRWMTGAWFRALQDSKLLMERARLDTVYCHRRSIYYKDHSKALRIDLGDKCYIPAKLLRAPMSADRQDLLTQLRHCGAEIDWVNSTAGEAAIDIWKQAVAMQDWRLVGLLSGLRVGHQEGDRPAQWVVSLTEWNFDMLLQIACFYPGMITQRHFGLTMTQCRTHTLWRDPVVAARVFEQVEREAGKHSRPRRKRKIMEDDDHGETSRN